MMKKNVTVYDIAQELGISSGTVSRALNNSTLISDEKREEILATAERMHYRKRSIKRQQTRAIVTVRLFLPAAKYDYIHLFYDVAELIEGIQEGFGDTRVHIITSINDGNLAVFESKKLGDIDGCIFAFTVPSAALETLLEEREIPFILLNREKPENNYVMIDSIGGMKRLVDVAWEKYGAQLKPCYVGFSPLAGVSKRREEGVSIRCNDLHIPFSDKDVYNLDSISELRSSILADILEKKYNTVFCFNDMIAVSLYQSALHLCLQIPKAFSLTGFDNSPILDLLDQRVNTIEFSLEQLGNRSGAWLLSRIINRDDIPIQENLEGAYILGETI
ncbi:MAG: LacI family DNA-binding transcriptional regulator [Sphaerochaeta sp.]|nr:LacI family DNA-binding transcriptional regulator [Sphaerochaeta sp.]